MLTAPRHLRSYTLIDWGHLELPAQSQHLDGHTSVCSDCPLAGRPPPPRRRPPRPLRCSSRKPVQLGPLSAHARGGVPCPCKADGAPHTPHPPEACPEGGHAPPLRTQRGWPLARAPGPFCAVLSPPGCPLSMDRGQAGHSSERPGEAKPASGAQFALLALPWSLQPPCWASPWWPAPAPPVTGLSREQGRAGVQSRHSERRG